MSANLPTKTPDAPPDKPAENKFDRFRPEMPTIPGVSQASRKAGRGVSGISARRRFQIGGGIAAVVLLGAICFWTLKTKSRSATSSSSDSDIAELPASPQPNPVAALHEGPTVAATVDELSKPWAAKKFIFVNPVTQEKINAIVIQLPGGDFWAFSLRAPFGQCDLEYVTDLSMLSTQYRFKASHPMVVSPCESTVFDPLKVGPLDGNTWARGEIVQGGSLRPPISIDVKVNGRSIVADGIE
jgi:hypothetical protein